MASSHWNTNLKIEVLGWVPWEPLCTRLLLKAPDQHLSGNTTRQGEECNCDTTTTKVGSSGTRAALKCCPALRQGGQTFLSSQQTNHCILAALGKGHNYGHGGLFEGNFHREDQLRAISYQHFQQQRECLSLEGREAPHTSVHYSSQYTPLSPGSKGCLICKKPSGPNLILRLLIDKLCLSTRSQGLRFCLYCFVLDKHSQNRNRKCK